MFLISELSCINLGLVEYVEIYDKSVNLYFISGKDFSFNYDTRDEALKQFSNIISELKKVP